MKKTKFIIAFAMVLLTACSSDNGNDLKVDYRGLLTDDLKGFDEEKFKDAEKKCSQYRLDEQSSNPWCEAKRKAIGCAFKKVCPDK